MIYTAIMTLLIFLVLLYSTVKDIRCHEIPIELFLFLVIPLGVLGQILQVGPGLFEVLTMTVTTAIAESVEEERLLEFVSHMERHAMGVPALHESKKGMLSVSKDDLLTICGAAAVTYESEKWRQKEIDLLERICEEGSCTLLPDDIQKELEAWKKGREAELLFSKDLQKRLEKWKQK